MTSAARWLNGKTRERAQDAHDIRSISLGNRELIDVILQRNFLHTAAARAYLVRATLWQILISQFCGFSISIPR